MTIFLELAGPTPELCHKLFFCSFYLCATMLTRDGVSLLVRSPNAVVDGDLFFQVIGIEPGISQAGHGTLSLTLSDGNQFIDC